jgi:lipopolysaccharide/colanic/teichoic acid biosynthesis glycosyltransferase
MYFDPNDRSAKWTMKGDQRVTRVGRLLRRTRLDEVPQLWNVLKGEMSLVGPRPEQVPLARRLAQLTPHYHRRHAVKPGITGWAQINMGYCGSAEESLRKLEYDLFYVRHTSLRLDLEVAYRTVSVVLTGKGSR